MARPRLLLTDHAGRRVPAGQTKVVLVDEHFIGKTALPASLTSTAGTVALTAPSNSTPGYVSVTTAAAVDALADIKTAQSYPIGQFSALLLELFGFRMDATSPLAEPTMLMAGSGGAGCYATETIPAGADAPMFRLFSGAVPANLATPVYDSWRTNGEGVLTRNVWLMASSGLKEIVMGEHDKALGWRDATGAWNDGMVAPGVQLRTKEAAPHGFRLTAFRLTGWLK